MPDELRYRLGMEVVDALVAQENEGMGRQLGDHGAFHLRGDAETALSILRTVPGEDTPEQMAEAYLSAIFHDTGYLTEPSRLFLDEGHPRWSTEHYNQSIRPLVAEALGDTAATDVEHYIRTHDSTDLDWQNDPVSSAVRTADNMAIFHQEKLPPVFRYVPGNKDVLTRMATGEVDVDGARAAMRDNIAATDYSPEIKERLNVAVDEVGAQTAKFTLGMLGGFVDRFDWVEDHVQVTMRRNEKMDLPQKVLDLGQAQFAKAAKAYGIDPAKFRQGPGVHVRGSDGQATAERRDSGHHPHTRGDARGDARPRAREPDLEADVLLAGAVITAAFYMTMTATPYLPRVGGINGDMVMATGIRAATGYAACGSLFPFGTRFELDDSLVACGFPRVVVCQDRGGMVGKYNLDLAYVGEGPIANDWKAARCVGKRRHRISGTTTGTDADAGTGAGLHASCALGKRGLSLCHSSDGPAATGGAIVGWYFKTPPWVCPRWRFLEQNMATLTSLIQDALQAAGFRIEYREPVGRPWVSKRTGASGKCTKRAKTASLKARPWANTTPRKRPKSN